MSANNLKVHDGLELAPICLDLFKDHLHGRVKDPKSNSNNTEEENSSIWEQRDISYRENTRSIPHTPTSSSDGSTINEEFHSKPEIGKTDQEVRDDEPRNQPTNENEFNLSKFLKDGYFEKRPDEKKLGVVFKDLTVEGVGTSTKFVKTLPWEIFGCANLTIKSLGLDLFNLLFRLIPISPKFGAITTKRNLIQNFNGLVKEGEILLVLGRSGSGSTTFLKAISNMRKSFLAVKGDVSYGGITASEQLKNYRGEVNYCEEDDHHIPSLTVEQTLKFALLTKCKKREARNIPRIIDGILKTLGISHTRHTLLGNQVIRGVSGGEMKRVSIAETLATKSAVVAWDNPTRGLDSSTALDLAKSLRIMADICGRTTLITLCQAGEEIYELVDKVLVIDEGRMVYQGPANKAKQYFLDLGYYCPERQTTPDFLTACTDPKVRKFRDDFVGPIPRGSVELEKAFRQSESYKEILRDMDAYQNMLSASNHSSTKEFKQSILDTKSKTVYSSSPYTISFARQVLICTKREFWLTMGDKKALVTKFLNLFCTGFVMGTLFYNLSAGTDGTFSKQGCLFFSIIFLGWLQVSEINKAMSGRNITTRHREYALYSPSAVVIARVLLDIPLLAFQAISLSILIYNLAGLTFDLGKFLVYFLDVFLTAFCMTSIYRMFASISPSLDYALRYSGVAYKLLSIYIGYLIPKTILSTKLKWVGWIQYINPIAYSFETVITNEFYDRSMTCAASNTLPNGPGYSNPAYQGCAFPGAELGSLSVPGSRYLDVAFQYSTNNIRKNFGYLLGFITLYILITIIASETVDFTAAKGNILEFKKAKKSKQIIKAQSRPVDEEKVLPPACNILSGSSTVMCTPQDDTKNQIKLSRSESIFTWQDLEYTIPYMGGERKLLNKVTGYAKPGVCSMSIENYLRVSSLHLKLVALLGASGAGKTTLLNVLSQRHKVGVISGKMLVDGRSPGPDFRRGTGFCEQTDLHDETATVREALEFSAILRQDFKLSRTEKIEHVDKIINLLDLGDLQDALIRSLGVEQRKRVTIGVELAARPNLLLFLDEPTSGLDSQSACRIVNFFKKLANAGQAIICTIHQPSSDLIQQFDMILTLNPGGNTIYFGPVGENGSHVAKYFADRGFHCPPKKNIAEFILETAAKGYDSKTGRKLNWNEEWLHSEEAKNITDEIKSLNKKRISLSFDSNLEPNEFASPVLLQTIELTKRIFTQHWRDPSYVYGKLNISVVIGLFNGFTFWNLGNTISDMKYRMFTCYMILFIPSTILNTVLPRYYLNRDLWETRELPSRIYGWVAFCTANIITEIPSAIFSAIVFWVLWYWPTGLPRDFGTSGYVFIMTILFFLFQASWGQWLGSFASSYSFVANILPLILMVFYFFNGVIQPYFKLPTYWRHSLYYLNPSSYWIGGVLAATLNDIVVHCAPHEASHFNPPPGSTCSTYANKFVETSNGYLMNPNATVNCSYCPYSSGIDYMRQLNIKPEDKWRNFVIFSGFCIGNWGLIYFLIWAVRVKKWTFGFGRLESLFKISSEAVQKLFRKK
ncbi:ABC multidrug transporter [Podosphaera aphanis]|nr:ABC multidrug transporter [Podosphaera aphanis]